MEKDTKTNSFNLDLEKMKEAGLHFGHKISSSHPKMKPYIFGMKNGIHIIDIKKTLREFEKTLEFIKKSVESGKKILFVGTKIQAKDLVKKTALACGFPYMTERWLGGFFTNFETIKKRIAYFKDLIRKRKTGEFDKYTKKERAKFDKKINDLERNFGGIKDLEKLPEIVFIVDIKKEITAVKEARKKGIKIIAIADTNADPQLADYIIPANDDALTSLSYILEKIKEVILKVKSKAQMPDVEENSKTEESQN